jgi:hypothetical protein
MKQKLLTLVLVLAIALGSFSVALAQNPAYTTAFTTSITYQNVDVADANSVQIHFYPDPTSTTPIIIDRPALPSLAGTSIFIGSLTQIDPNFRGSAIMFADRRLVATLVQVPNSTTVKNRPLSNGFESGSPTILLATVLKNTFGYHSIFSVQNTDSEDNDLTIDFYKLPSSLGPGETNPVHTITTNVESGASYYVDAGQVAALGTSFNGSVSISAERGDASNGSIVATAMELSISGIGAYAFESTSGGDSPVYMPSALCQAFGGFNSFYAVQNTSSTTAAVVTVTYSNGATQGATIQPLSKNSFNTCNATGMTTGFSGSATITSGQPAVAIGKVTGNGTTTAFLGASSGGDRLAVPYVRWTESQYTPGGRQRTFIAIQNITGSSIPAGSIVVNYYDRDGNLVTSHTPAFGGNPSAAIPDGGKVNSNAYSTADPDAAEFGYYTNGFGGSAIVECSAPGCQIIAVARVNSKLSDTETAGEDFNGIVIP